MIFLCNRKDKTVGMKWTASRSAVSWTPADPYAKGINGKKYNTYSIREAIERIMVGVWIQQRCRERRFGRKNFL